jgi:hypothetical protein
MNITVLRATVNVGGSGTLDIIGDGFWTTGAIIQDDFSFYDNTDDNLLLPPGWHDIGVSVKAEDNDFISTSVLDVIIGRFNGAVPVWSQWRQRGQCGTSSPVKCARGAVYFPSSDTLAIGLAQNTGNGKDVVLEVQVFG